MVQTRDPCHEGAAPGPDGRPILGRTTSGRPPQRLAVTERHTQSHGDPPQSCVACPQLVSLADRRPKDVRIDQPNASTVKPPVFDERKYLVVLGLARSRQGMEEFEDHPPTCEGAASEFADHERMAHDLARIQDDGQPAIAAAQVVDPDRCVDKDHRWFDRDDRGLRSAWPATGGRCGLAIGATERGELLGCFAGDQCLEAHANELGFLADAGKPGGSGERFFIDVECRPHASFFTKVYALVKSGPRDCVRVRAFLRSGNP